jgi:hypothetical protein
MKSVRVSKELILINRMRDFGLELNTDYTMRDLKRYIRTGSFDENVDYM